MRELLVLIAIATLACDESGEATKLENLVSRGVTRPEIVSELGSQYTLYEKGRHSWQDLDRFLAREPPNTLGPLREKAQKYEVVMHYTTMWQITWLFFDEKQRLRDFYLSSQ